MQIADHFSSLLYAFQISEDHDLVQLLGQPDCLWEIAQTGPDQSYLFSHVYQFLSANNQNQSLRTVDPDNCILLQLKHEHPGLLLQHKIFSQTHQAVLPKSDEKVIFKISSNRTFAPLLVYIPVARIGLLIFSLHFEDLPAESDQMLQAMHQLRIFRDGKPVQIRTLANKHPVARLQHETLLEKLSAHTGLSAEECFDGDHYVWNIPCFINYLLGNLKPAILDISPPRLQSLTYTHLQQAVKEEQIVRALMFRFARVYSSVYQPSPQALEDDSHFIQPFKAVHYVTYREGACILINEDYRKDGAFLHNYGHQVVQQSLFWTWLLAHIQHYALISAAGFIARDYRTAKPDVTKLRQLVERLYQVQIRCIFSQISHHTHHNHFYTQCCKSLGVPGLLDEIKTGLRDLHNVVDESNKTRQSVLLWSIGIGIATVQVANSLKPNFLITLGRLVNDAFGGDFASWRRSLSPLAYHSLHNTIVLISNMAAGIIMALLSRYIWLKYFLPSVNPKPRMRSNG